MINEAIYLYQTTPGCIYDLYMVNQAVEYYKKYEAVDA